MRVVAPFSKLLFFKPYYLDRRDLQTIPSQLSSNLIILLGGYLVTRVLITL